MMRVLVDVNVVLDVLRNRVPHARASAAVWASIERGSVEGMLSAHAVTTVHYLISRDLGEASAKSTVSELLKVFRVAAVDGNVLLEALQLPCPDFEDAVSAVAARQSGCELIVTRDPKGFRHSPIRVLTPELAAPLLSL